MVANLFKLLKSSKHAKRIDFEVNSSKKRYLARLQFKSENVRVLDLAK